MKILRKSEIIRGSQQTITNRSEKEKLVEREREREYETLALSLARLQRVQRPCIINFFNPEAIYVYLYSDNNTIMRKHVFNFGNTRKRFYVPKEGSWISLRFPVEIENNNNYEKKLFTERDKSSVYSTGKKTTSPYTNIQKWHKIDVFQVYTVYY